MAVTPQIELDRIKNPSKEALDEIAAIIDKYTKTSIINGQQIKHLSKDGPIDQIFKEIKTKGYKKPSISKELFKKVLESKGITTYDNYRTNKIVFTLQDVLRKNNGDVLSIKPSAIAKILPEFAIKGSKGGEGLPAFRTFLNYLEGSPRLADRSGLQVPTVIAGKPVSQVVDELKQNFLEVKGGRARGDFRVFNETKLLDRLANENPNATANELKNIYEQNNGTKFRERLKNLYLAKTGQVTNKTTGGKSILEAVKTRDITNKIPTSLKKSFAIYGKDYNFGRFSRFASEETDPKKIRYYNDIARRFFTTGATEKLGTKGLVAEHGLPIAAYDRGVADISTRAKIDGYVTTAVNNWKAKNFDFPIFRPGGLADQYANADAAVKSNIEKQIKDRLKFTKSRTPDLVKNIKFDFTNGVFTASSSTPEINEKNISNLIKKGEQATSVFNKTGGFDINFFNDVKANARAGGDICQLPMIKGKASGGPALQCVDAVNDALEKDPKKLAQNINKSNAGGGFNKIKNSSTKFLNALKDNPNLLKGRFGTIAAAGVGTVLAGAGAGALVKAFRNDDPSTYLTNDSQMEGMIISDVEDKGKEVDDNILLDNQFKLELAGAAGLTAPIAKGVYQRSRYSTPPLLESPLEFDQELKTLKRTIRQITHPKGKKAKRISEAGREVLRNSRIRINQINEAIETARIGKEGKGVFRSAFGLEKGVLGKGLWALGAPAIQLPATLGYIAQDIREGKDASEIATNPLNYLGAAFINPSVKALAKAGASRGLLGIASLGLAGTAAGAVALPAISIGAGLATLGTLGYQGYKLFTGNDDRSDEDFFR